MGHIVDPKYNGHEAAFKMPLYDHSVNCPACDFHAICLDEGKCPRCKYDVASYIENLLKKIFQDEQEAAAQPLDTKG